MPHSYAATAAVYWFAAFGAGTAVYLITIKIRKTWRQFKINLYTWGYHDGQAGYSSQAASV